MVIFVCNGCNESLKKNRVERHCSQCKKSQIVSCVDCGKDFWGESYQSHIKCVTEEQKYFGKGHAVKVNKGELKQQQWTEQIQAAIKQSSANPKLKCVLTKLEDFPNVPRKKAKFENFLKCSLRVYSTDLHRQAWDLLMSKHEKQTEITGSTLANDKEMNGLVSVGKNGSPHNLDQEMMEGGKKLSKKERKEERKRKMQKMEKKDKVEKKDKGSHHDTMGAGDMISEGNDIGLNVECVDSSVTVEKKKGKKRKNNEKSCENNCGECHQNGTGGIIRDNISHEPVVKKLKGFDVCPLNSTLVCEENKGVFNWSRAIMSVLSRKGDVSVKRLRKKVLAEYVSYGKQRPEEKLFIKFNKKLNKLPHVKVTNDRVMTLVKS